MVVKNHILKQRKLQIEGRGSSKAGAGGTLCFTVRFLLSNYCNEGLKSGADLEK